MTAEAGMAKAKVLVVDDTSIELSACVKELTRAGHEVFGAASGREAIEIAERERPDIVFTDLVMPGMDGVEVCRKLRELRPETVVILVSAHPEDAARSQMDFIDAGGREEWLRKPLGEDELAKAVGRILEEKGCQR